jgi:hypothetical protein
MSAKLGIEVGEGRIKFRAHAIDSNDDDARDAGSYQGILNGGRARLFPEKSQQQTLHGAACPDCYWARMLAATCFGSLK